MASGRAENIASEMPRRMAPPAAGRLRVLPLGGVGEFGKNCLVLECGEDMIVVDCGQQFPEDDMFGIDTVIPDFSYLLEHIDRLRAVILTHGHEDHIGGVPYLLRQLGKLRVPIYGTRLTLAIIKAKLQELAPEANPLLEPVEEHERVVLGSFDVECIPVMHSMPQALSLLIRTPVGNIFHTGDYKFDNYDGGECAISEAVQRAAGEETMLLLADSTNVDREGFSTGEETVRGGLEMVIAAAESTVILACFSTSLHRAQSVLDIAERLGRKVAVCGMSLERNFGIATELGLLRYSDYLVRPLQEVVRLPPGERLILTTGTQGEPMSALARLSRNGFKGYRVTPGDLVILSSRIIPGNERPIWRMINNFYRHGARVVTEREAMVHGSGHACRGEMCKLFGMLRPRHFMPVHGEMRQLIIHRDLAVSCGVEPERVFVIENGTLLELGKDGGSVAPTEWAGQVLVDGRLMDGVEEVVLRDRRHLSADGMLTVILVIDKQTHRIIAGPDIVSRGFVCVEDNEPLIEACRKVVIRTFDECDNEGKEQWDVVKAAVRKALRRFLSEETDRYPVILPVVVEI